MKTLGQLKLEIMHRGIAFAHAPVFDPQAVDAKGRKLSKPSYRNHHLFARARVYMALEQWDKALADVEVVVQRQLNSSASMSMRARELDESEALRDAIKAAMPAAGGHE